MKTGGNGAQALEIGDRGPDGRFAPGCRPGPGRKPGDGREQYLEAFKRAVTPEDIEAVVKRVVKDAKDGNMVAAKLLLERCLPPVSETLRDAEVPSGPSIQARILALLAPDVRLQVIRAELAIRGSLPVRTGANELDTL